MNHESHSQAIRLSIEIAVYLVLIFLIMAWCLQILSPFVSLLAWGAIIGIAIYPVFEKLRNKLGGKKKLAVLIITLIGLAVVIVPAWMFADSMVSGLKGFHDGTQTGEFHINPPSESVKDWPIIGERMFDAWAAASSNLESFLEEHHEQLQGAASFVVKKTAGVGMGILLFAASILVGAAFLANAESVKASLLRFCRRLAGDKGEQMMSITAQTIRSVTVGVLGIATIQAIGGGIGMYAVGIPATGVWTLAILILAIAQLPPWLILGPMIVYVFSYETTTVSLVFMVWSLIVSFADMVLKPLFLGRGVAVPMLVILLGAIGGMIMSGVMGLFVGAVILALGYTLFQWWLKIGEDEEGESNASAGAATESAAPASTD